MPKRMKLEEHVRALRDFYRGERRMPSYAEMADLFGYRSKNAVAGVVRRLEELGYVQRGAGGRLSATGTLAGSIRLLGSVQAGFPSPAEEELVDVMSLDDFLVQRPEATYMLTVSGDSMIDAGIHPGDVVLVEKGRTARSNDIVVAQVDGEWTLKYFVQEQGRVRLEPANRAYGSIQPKQSLFIAGVVTAVVRRYR